MKLFADLVDLILPASCLCCRGPGAVWCPSCQPASLIEAVPLASGFPIVAAGEYADELRTVLLHYKERGHRSLAAQLAGYLADAVDGAIRAPDSVATVGVEVALAAVPSRRGAARARGGDHVLRLARAVGRQLNAPVLPLLRLTGPVADSAGLDPARRRLNLTGRMMSTVPPNRRTACGTRVILLDDIVTTGATLTEASRALGAAGWRVHGAAVIAATKLRSSAPGSAERRCPT